MRLRPNISGTSCISRDSTGHRFSAYLYLEKAWSIYQPTLIRQPRLTLTKQIISGLRTVLTSHRLPPRTILESETALLEEYN
ncbi:hypothetical protein TNCV_1549311 [Trichonephila clavipes]|nr:hypothetical protein TNCV_1549311 [Trichonephila clavipes]